MKSYNIIVVLIFFIMLTPLATAQNLTENTTNSTTNITMNLTTNLTVNSTIPTTIPTLDPNLPSPEEFYGSALYSDNTPILIGSIITVKNQKSEVIGSFNMTFNGSYGDSYATAPRLIVHAHSDDDLTFYVNDIKSSTASRKFDSGSIKRADITMSAGTKPTPTPTPTPVPTTIPTTIATPEPTPVPTTIPTTIATPIPTPTPAPSLFDDVTIKFLGVLLIGIGICVFGALVTYYILTKKMKRDDEEDIIL